MLKAELKQIKETIRDLIRERKNCDEIIEQRIQNIKNEIDERKTEYDIDNAADEYFFKNYMERQQKKINKIPYDVCQEFGNDISIHIIYNDGSEFCALGSEIVSGELTPKMQHIVYASYMDGYIEYDTETGELNYDVSEDDQFEAYQEYQNQIEIKFNTEWGRQHSDKI